MAKRETPGVSGNRAKRLRKPTTVKLRKRRFSKTISDDPVEEDDHDIDHDVTEATPVKKKSRIVKKKKKKTKADKKKPMELPSNRPVRRYQQIQALAKKHTRRDPRFDPMCGDFSEQGFRDAYGFVDKLKEQEQKDLKRLQKKVKSKKKKAEIASTIKAYKQSSKAQVKADRERHLVAEWKKEEFKARAAGKNPYYLKKSDKKKLMLADQFMQLKKTGGLKKTIEKKRKRQAAKDRRFLPDKE